VGVRHTLGHFASNFEGGIDMSCPSAEGICDGFAFWIFIAARNHAYNMLDMGVVETMQT
jgi:hypothetical protein